MAILDDVEHRPDARFAVGPEMSCPISDGISARIEEHSASPIDTLHREVTHPPIGILAIAMQDLFDLGRAGGHCQIPRARRPPGRPEPSASHRGS